MSDCVWLVDIGYVVKAAKKSDMKLNYIAARDLLTRHYGSVSAYLFNSIDYAYGIPAGLQAFYNTMTNQGMVVRLHPMSGDSAAGSHRQRRVDVDFACHAVWQASLPETRVLVLTTGDQDMVPAAELCKNQFGVEIILFTFNSDVSSALAGFADQSIRFENFRSELEL